MKISISYPPIEKGKGIPLLSQNRQFQWFNEATYIYPIVPASAATLLKNKGFDVIWDDAIAEGLSYAEWKKKMLHQKPELIAIETKTPVVKSHYNIINDIKKEIPGIKIVLMGDHATAYPEEAFEFSEVDFIVTGGDYDFLLLSLAESLTKKTPLEPGIYWRDPKGAIKSSGNFERKYELDSLPLIDRDLTKWKLYAYNNGNYKKTPGTYIMSGRDCWYHQCTFCSWTTLFPFFNKRKPDNVLDEIGNLIETYGAREIMDDTGTFPIGGWLEEFCEGMIRRGYSRKVNIDCNMRLGKALTRKDADLMKKAGFRLVLVGIESANQVTLDRIKKGENIEEMIDAVKMLRKAGLFPHITIMFGYPWETEEEALKTLKLGQYLMIKNYAYTMQATMVIPYPGTPLFNECREKGWLETTDWDRYDMREPVMKTPIGKQEIMKLVQGLYSVSFNPEFLARKLAGIRDLEDLKYFIKAGKKVLGHIFDFKNTGG